MEKLDISEALAGAQQSMLRGQFKDAMAAISDILSFSQENRDALYMKAVVERYSGVLKDAERTLIRLLTQSPTFGRGYQERGYLLKTTGDHEGAQVAFEQAITYNPTLMGAWQQLVTLYVKQKSDIPLMNAQHQLARLQALPKELTAVSHYFYEDHFKKAEALCRAFLKVNPAHFEGIRLLASIAERLGSYEEAEFLLKTALTLTNSKSDIAIDLLKLYRKRQKFPEALEVAKQLVEQDTRNPLFHSYHAVQALQSNDYQTALKGFDHVLKLLPTDAVTHTSKGHALKTIGDQKQAIKSYKAALAITPSYGDAWYGLANLKTYCFSMAELETMESLIEAPYSLPHRAQIQVHFALGKAYEDQKEYGQSFYHYQKGNGLRYTENRYCPDQMEKEFELQKSICTDALYGQHVAGTVQAEDPIFIVGLPRAGSTLVEQILASHSLVDGTMELPDILMIAQEIRGRQRLESETGYPLVLPSLPKETLNKYGEQYLENTQQHRQCAPYFTDKMPNNFRHISLIKLILPKAKIIDVRRNPMDCCFSGFKQLFAEGQEFTYNLKTIGRYYRSYVALMDHFDQVFPGDIHRVRYEDLVADSEQEIRRLLDYCGLPFEQNCLEFYKTERPIKTASSEQVREQINPKGLEAWKTYEDYLWPLKEALGTAVD
ncbi:sulfotransferase [Temperatibacter marinus]|uniref:Sulfotransferase n=1 Tax=Temperatibacter marinus TaxID=1456591 RepID=A0AA52EJY4_9PROT|nr:sulfotransferase [Temperatibacter marinus]WND03897.1 sulfotransferase [Temperatibacter marinus]